MKLEDITGIGPAMAQKLREAGYSIEGLATARGDEVASVVKVSYRIAKGWCNEAQTIVLSKMKIETSSEVEQDMKKNIQYIPTGSKKLDALLGGGFATAQTVGLTGEFSTGKSQLCNQAIVNCIKMGRKAVFIETEPNTFVPSRIKEIAIKRNVKIDIDGNLLAVRVQSIPTVKAQYLAYRLVKKQLENKDDIGLVVVDSFTAKFRTGYSRREMLPIRRAEFGEHFQLIDYLAAKYNICWLLTCQVMGIPTAGGQLGAMKKAGIRVFPVGGHYLLHSISTWLALEQKKTEEWKAHLFDSSHLAPGTADFRITSRGIEDV